MKFGKEFASQVVPEWQSAYMNYNYLKIILKEILIFRCRKNRSPPVSVNPPPNSTLKRRVSLYRAFSGLTSHYINSPKPKNDDKEDEVILVSALEEEENEAGGSERNYQTMFLRSSEEGGENELVFFRKLDDEFNKVIKFYKGKVEEVVKEAEDLNKQMDALIALRFKVDFPVHGVTGADRVSTPATFSPFINQGGPASPLDVIQEIDMSEEGNGEDKMDTSAIDPKTTTNKGKEHFKSYISTSLEVLNHVKINVDPETPVSTLKNVLFSGSKSALSFSKEELTKAEAQMKQAFIEFHRKLRLLKSYCFLNQLAFSKIMKKYDKITSRNASKAYLEMVEKFYLGHSHEVARLMERVEAAFIKHFSNGNRHKGMTTLRPKAKREKHRVTFFVGCFLGCSLALVVAIILTIHARNLLKSEGRAKYMDNIFPLYSLFGFIVLHMLMFLGNVYYWRRFRVNYPFIFGLKPGTEMGYREILLLSCENRIFLEPFRPELG